MEPIILIQGQVVPDPVLLEMYAKEWEKYLRFDGLAVPINQDRMAGIYGDHGGNMRHEAWKSPLWLAFSGTHFPEEWNDKCLPQFQRSINAMTRFYSRYD